MKKLAAVLLLGALAACSPRENYRGAILDEKRLEEVTPGKTQAQVTQLLGSPSAQGTFSERGNTWYYIYRHTEALAFLAEKVVDQRVIEVDFDGGGSVREVRQYGLKDGVEVALSSDVTPTKGKELSILEQMLGNVGKFTGPKK